LEKLEIRVGIYLSDHRKSPRFKRLEVNRMTSDPASLAVPAAHKPVTPSFVLLTPKETAKRLKVSTSWLAKARMRGDGPPFIKVGRAIRYSEAALIQWMRGRQRLSTSEQ
jgi:predicted DNA-binding transcriptional regulator AlpA